MAGAGWFAVGAWGLLWVGFKVGQALTRWREVDHGSREYTDLERP